MTLSHHCTVAWVTQPEAPEGREGRYQAGPKGCNLVVGARTSSICIFVHHLCLAQKYSLSPVGGGKILIDERDIYFSPGPTCSVF